MIRDRHRVIMAVTYKFPLIIQRALGRFVWIVPRSFYRAGVTISCAVPILECHSIVLQRSSRRWQKQAARRACLALFPRRSSFSFADDGSSNRDGRPSPQGGETKGEAGEAEVKGEFTR